MGTRGQGPVAISNGHGTISTHQQLAVGWDSVVMAVEFLSFYHCSCIIFCTSVSGCVLKKVILHSMVRLVY